MDQFIVASNLPPLVFGLALVSLTAIRSLWLRRTAGAKAYVIDHRDPVHHFVAQTFAFVVVGLVVYFAAIAVFPTLEARLGRPDWTLRKRTDFRGCGARPLARRDG